MKKARKGIGLLCVIALLGVSGCSDDDDAGMMVPNGDIAAIQAAVQGAANDVGVPMVALVNVIVQLVTQLPRGLPTVQCDSGAADLGPTGITFTDCMLSGTLINGSIGFDQQTGDLDFNVTIDGATSITGPALFLPFVTCGPGIQFGPGFSVGGTSVTGTLEACGLIRGGTVFPVGQLVATLLDPPLLIVMTFDGSSTVQVLVEDLESMPLANCSVDLLPSVSATCQAF